MAWTHFWENRNVWELLMDYKSHNVDCAAAGLDPDEISGDDSATTDLPAHLPAPHTCAPFAGIATERTPCCRIRLLEEATVAIHAKGPGVDLRVERVESIMA